MSTSSRNKPLLRELSNRARFGCKGPGAESWLREQGFAVPEPANSWVCEDDVLVGRLATSEFLVESLAGDSPRVQKCAAALLDPAQRRSGLVPVLRQDKVLELRGARANELLVEVCNVDFRPLVRDAQAARGALVMTSMIGVGVTVVPRRVEGAVLYTIWCDPSFGHYLESTLAGVASELGEAVS